MVRVKILESGAEEEPRFQKFFICPAIPSESKSNELFSAPYQSPSPAQLMALDGCRRPVLGTRSFNDSMEQSPDPPDLKWLKSAQT